MIARSTQKCRSRLSASKKSSKEQPSISLSSAHLWPRGDGKIAKKEVLISGWNINGIRAALKKDALRPFMSEGKPDFLCLNQTKVDLKGFQDELQNSDPFPAGYHHYWNFCKIRPGYSGVMVLTPHKPINIFQDIPSQSQHSQEGRLITLEYEKFFLVNVYKPNSGKKLQRLDYVVQYEKAFNKYMKELQAKKDVVIFGDMNMAHTSLDLHNPEANVNKPGCLDSQRWSLNDLTALGFVDTYRKVHPERKEYTYWARFCNSRERNLGWRMDYILSTHKNLQILDATVHDQVKGSDHCPVSALLKLN